MQLIFTLIVCILISFLFTLLAKKLKLSGVVALIVAGILMGSPLLRNFILEPNTSFVVSLGNVGLIFLMFLAGMEVSWSMFYKERKNALIVASFAAFIPMILGFIVFLVMGFPLLISLTIGICMSITAEATKARELLELKKLKTKLGSLMLGAGITDDIIGASSFIFICYLFAGTLITKELMIFLVSVLAFITGIFIHKFIGREKKIIYYFEKSLLFFVIPFFFIGMGINFSLYSLVLEPLLLVVVIIIAIIGKMLGVMLTTPLTKLRIKQLYLIGWGMNSRGAVELAIVFIAFKLGLLSVNIYSSLVVMALVTTLIFPFIIRRMIKNNPKIMG